jgi:hypothetical protein
MNVDEALHSCHLVDGRTVAGSEEKEGRGGYREQDLHVWGQWKRWWDLGIGWRGRGGLFWGRWSRSGVGQRRAWVKFVKDFLGQELVKGDDAPLESKEDTVLEGFSSGRNYKTDRGKV